MCVNNAVMDGLKSKLSEILYFISDKDDVVYLDYPFHYNVGDILIFLGGVEFLRKNNIRVKKFYNINNFSLEKVKKNITKNTTILCHGGGNFGDIYQNHQKMRELVVQNFPDNRIIFLPQTIFFEDIESQKLSLNILKDHENLIFFLRDLPSLKLIQQISEKSYVMPDMAHFLYGDLKANQQAVKDELYFLRRDSEQIENQHKLLGKEAKSLDWCDIITYQDEIILKKLKRLIKLNKMFKISQIDNYIFEVWYRHCWKLVYRCINEFSIYEKVITSRLHGHILTCLLERNSVLLNNSYGKNKGYYELWTKKIAEYIDQSS